MMLTGLASCLLTLLLVQPTPLTAEATLAAGVRQVDDGDFQGAVETLDPLVRLLASDPGRRGELVTTYVNLGVAYVMLKQEEPGRGYFREALRLDPELTLAADRYPAKVLRAFQGVRPEPLPPTTLPAPPPTTQPAPPTTTLPRPLPSPSPIAPSPTPVPSPVAPRAGEVRKSERDGLEYVWLPAGSFEMGCVPGDAGCGLGEAPRHTVKFSAGHWFGRGEVSVLAYKRFAADTNRELLAVPDSNPEFSQDGHPMVFVNWFDAVAFCEWAGGRLPSEAEWEYAARGGEAGWKYVWGPQEQPFGNQRPLANVADESARSRGLSSTSRIFDGLDDGYPFTSPVGAYPANGFGLFDMAGNVWEWCSDWYAQSYYGGSPTQDPTGPSRGTHRVLRGGSWASHPADLRASYRWAGIDEGGAREIGFRCVRDNLQ